MSEILYRSIARELNLNADEWIATLRNEQGGDWLSEEDIAKQISLKLSARVTAAKAESRSSGQGEQNRKIVNFTKRKGFENSDDLKGDDLLNAFWEWHEGQAPAAADGVKLEDLDIETLRKLPQIKQIELLAQQGAGQKFQALQKEYTDYRGSMEAYKSKLEAEKVDEKAFAKTASYARALGVILKVEGSEIDENERLDTIHQRIKSRYKIGIDSTGEPFVQNEDGSQMNDSFGDPIKYKNIVLDVSKKIYGVSAQDPNHSGSGIQPALNGKPGEKVPQKIFGTQQDYDSFMKTTTDRDKRREAAESWQYYSNEAAGN